MRPWEEGERRRRSQKRRRSQEGERRESGEGRDLREEGSASRGRGSEDWGVSKEGGGVRTEGDELVEESGIQGKRSQARRGQRKMRVQERKDPEEEEEKNPIGHQGTKSCCFWHQMTGDIYDMNGEHQRLMERQTSATSLPLPSESTFSALPTPLALPYYHHLSTSDRSGNKYI